MDNANLALYSNASGFNFTTQSLTGCGSVQLQDQQLSFVRASLIYQFIAAAYFSEGPWVPQAFADKAMFHREHNSRSYSSIAYHFSFYVRMFFTATIKGTFFPVFGYFLAKLTLSAEAYFTFAIIFGGMSAVGASMALLCSCTFPSLQIAMAVFVLINIVAQSLSGYWIVQDYIGWWFRWAYYINVFRYAFEGAILGQSLPNAAKSPINGYDVRYITWLFAFLVLIFAIVFQLSAFAATWLTHRNGTVSGLAMIDEEDDARELAQAAEDAEKMQRLGLRGAQRAADDLEIEKQRAASDAEQRAPSTDARDPSDAPPDKITRQNTQRGVQQVGYLDRYRDMQRRGLQAQMSTRNHDLNLTVAQGYVPTLVTDQDPAAPPNLTDVASPTS